MNTTSLLTGLHTWIDLEPPGHGAEAPLLEPGIIAFWETPGSTATCRLLSQATTALRHCFTDRPFDTEPEGDRLPDRWLSAALAGPATEWCHPGGGQLAGIGLIAAEGDRQRLQAWIACPAGAALVWRRTWCPVDEHDPAALRPVEAHECLEVDTPLWWDDERRLANLERFRAAITGNHPRLPQTEQSPITRTPALCNAAWPGPR